MASLIRIAIALALLTGCGAALADPVSIIAAIATYALPASYGIYIAAAALVLSAAESRRKQRAAAAAQKAQYNASLQDRNVTVLSSESPWHIVYGSPSPVGGSVVAILTSGDKDQFKHLVVVFAAHECTAIDEIYVEGNAVGPLDGAGWATTGMFCETSIKSLTESLLFDPSGNVTTLHPVGSLLAIEAISGTDVIQVNGTASGNVVNSPAAANLYASVTYTYTQNDPRVNVQKHLSPGGVDTADAFLINAAPSVWTGAHLLSGFTYVVITLDLNFGMFQGGPPNITAKLRGKKVLDYRTGLTGYSSNNALCVADFITSVYGMGAATSQIDNAAVIAAANACDAQGYSCDGLLSSDQARDASLTTLEDSMAGGTHFSGGVWRIMAGAWASPVLTLSDNTTLAGPIEVVQASQPREGRFNGVRGQYVAASGLGVSADFTPYSVASYVAADGLALTKDVTYPMTGTNALCQKLAAIAVEQGRLGLTINYPAHLSAWKLQPGDRVTVNNTELGFASKTFRLVDWTFIANAPLGLVLTEDMASVWTGTFSAPDANLVTSNLANPYARPPAPANLIAASGTGILQKSGDGTIITRVLATWIASTVRSVLQGGFIQLQWRLASSTADVWQSTDLPADSSSFYLVGPNDGDLILLRVRFVSGFNVQGDWNTITHTVVGKTAPPSAPSFVAATQTLVFWGAVTDLDLAGYRVRSFPGETGAVWSRATPLHTALLTSSPWTITGSLFGVQTIMVVAEDTTGNQSAAVSTIVDFGQPDASNAVQVKDYQALAYPGTDTNCSVSGGNLVAALDPVANRYTIADLYGETDVYAVSYLDMTWVSEPFVPRYQGGTLSLNAGITGASGTIEYQIDGSTLIDDYASADDYADPDLYGAGSSFAAWPGALLVNRMQGVIFRVSAAGGVTQGQLAAFAPTLVMPDVRQSFGNVVVGAAGTRLAPSAGTPPRNWITLKTVQITPVVDGGGAIAGRVLDFSPTLGPLTQLVDITGSAVAGRATIDIGGLADG